MMNLRGIGLMLFVSGLAVMPFLYTMGQPFFDDLYDSMYIEIEHEGIITDKWKRIEPVFLMGGDERFYFEINNNFTVRVEADEWYNYEVGQYRNWTTTEFRRNVSAQNIVNR